MGAALQTVPGNLPVKALIWTMTILITLSTLFLRQHSVIDVVAGAALSLALMIPAYRINWEKLFPEIAPSANSAA